MKGQQILFLPMQTFVGGVVRRSSLTRLAPLGAYFRRTLFLIVRRVKMGIGVRRGARGVFENAVRGPYGAVQIVLCFLFFFCGSNRSRLRTGARPPNNTTGVLSRTPTLRVMRRGQAGALLVS